MPEGPSIIILKEEAEKFIGESVISVYGNAKQDLQKINGRKIMDLQSWGKQFLICFNTFYVRIHLLLFGSYRIDEKRDMQPRLSLRFRNGEINFYNASVKIIEGKPEDTYDWSIDVMSDKWSPQKAFTALKSLKNLMVCDVLLNQNIFAGSGKIVKNEVLFKMFIHPESQLSALPVQKKRALVKAVRNYCFDFYTWKKAYEFRKHWLIYRARICPRCKIPVSIKITGTTQRKSFYCNSCQVLYKGE